MRPALSAIALVVFAASCSSEAEPPESTAPPATTPRSSTTTQATTTQPATATTTAAASTTEPTTTTEPNLAQFALSLVGYGDSAMVVITNIGGGSGNLGGHWLCQRPAYFEIPPVELAPLEAVAIDAGGRDFSPPPGTKTVDEVATIGTLMPSGGEIGLYRSNDFGSSDAIVSYVEWGASNHGRSSVAVSAGIWSEGSFVATDDTATSIVAVLLPGEDPQDWEIVTG